MKRESGDPGPAMLTDEILKHPTTVLTARQREQSFEDGCLVAAILC